MLQEMATLLNTGLTKEQLAASLRMMEQGANPDSLAVRISSISTRIQLNRSRRTPSSC